MSFLAVSIMLLQLFQCWYCCDMSAPPDAVDGYSDMDWLNDIVSSWYTVNNEKVHQVVKKVLETELNKATPDIIEKISLEECTFGSDTPRIKGIKTKVVEPSCSRMASGKQKKVIVDAVISIDAPDFEFKMGVDVSLLPKVTAALQSISLQASLRITALFSDAVPFPGIRNACVTMTERPDLNFNVELLDLIDIDTLGVDNLIATAIEDIIVQQLVYPGRLYIDTAGIGAGRGVEVIMMPRDGELMSGVVTTEVRVQRIRDTTDKTDLEVSVEVEGSEKKETLELRTDPRSFSHNSPLASFDDQQLVVRAWESRLIFKDIQYGALKVDLADMEFSLPTVSETFTNEERNVQVEVEVKSYLLPLIALKQEGSSVTDYKTRFSGCDGTNQAINTGVLYVHIHCVTGVPKMDDSSKSDPFVTVYYEGKQIMKTKEVSNSANPIFNERVEILTQNFAGSQLVFKVDDADVWPNSDDPIGTAQITLGPETIRVVNRGIKLDTKSGGNTVLHVSVVFRSVPLV